MINKQIERKFIAVAISSLAIATVSIIAIGIRQAIALPASAVNQIVKKSTVRIDGKGKGSGVIFASDDYGYIVLTNQHVVEDSGEYHVITADGITHIATDIQELPGADLALVYFDTDQKYAVITRGNSDTLVEGQKLHIAGYPGSQNIASNRTYRFMSESLVGFLAPSDIKDGYELIYSGEAIPGMSGSPIFDEAGHLIGVYGLTDIDFTTGTSYLYGIPVNTALEIAFASGIELERSGDLFDQPSGAIDLFAPFIPNSVSTENNNNNNVGFETIGSAEINKFTIAETIYIGECPGVKLETQEATFFSHNTQTSPGRRVIITNVTRGLNRDPFPYTDREYERGQISEKTRIAFGSQHSRRKFVVLPGKNLFRYEIVQTEDNSDLETVLEEGTFSAVAQKKSFYVRRDKKPVEEIYCSDNDRYCDKEEQKVRRVYKCPSGNRLFGYDYKVKNNLLKIN
ncbi:MAG: serine protease [Cyanobacteria bacterium P01_G01_bin.19]